MKNLLEEANKMLRSLSTGTGSQASSTVSPTSQEESRAEVVEKLQQQLNSSNEDFEASEDESRDTTGSSGQRGISLLEASKTRRRCSRISESRCGAS